MRQNYAHLTDEDLLLYASGESGETAVHVAEHFSGCESCRQRLEQLQTRFAEISKVYRQETEEGLSPVAESREALKARMRQMGGVPERKGLDWRWAAAAAACLLLVLGLRTIRWQTSGAELEWPERPDLRLTPGATVPVTQSDVCRSQEPRVPAISVSLQEKVFERYGVTPPPDGQYELDYLITPELGGATDVHNLWPEPYHNAVWNAHVKDQLEDRLHSMVCGGQVDLATAQRDIATDWIAAYRKYFHANAPIPSGSRVTLPESGNSLPTT